MSLDDKVERVPDSEKTIPEGMEESSFTNGEWKQGVTTEPVTLYRTYDSRNPEGANGAYWTTEKPEDRMAARMDTARPMNKPEWGDGAVSAYDKVDSITIPEGTTIRYGTAAPQTTSSGNEMHGGAQQVFIDRETVRSVEHTTEDLGHDNEAFDAYRTRQQNQYNMELAKEMYGENYEEVIANAKAEQDRANTASSSTKAEHDPESKGRSQSHTDEISR